MTEGPSEYIFGTWAPAQCPFRVAYSLRALDDIRLAVVDAFFSVPHGGVEIGGILLGKREGMTTTILDFAPLDCEHAFGPSFTLSPKDVDRLTALLEAARKDTSGFQPVGWYHSHTRSGIFLSDVDLDIHKRFFPSQWHVALVLKPHTFQPTRAGIFFREADGSVHSQASYLEFPVEPLAAGVTGSSVRADAQPGPAPALAVMPSPSAEPEPEPEPEPASTPEPEPEIATPPPAPPPIRRREPETPTRVPERRPVAIEPNFRFLEQEPSRRWPVKSILAVVICLGLGIAGYETRTAWLPGLTSLWPRANTAPMRLPAAPSLGLTLADREGDLSITWDHTAPATRAATSGTMEISSGGGAPMAYPLDATQLHSGSLTFRRETEKVDVIMSVDGPEGRLGRQSSSFVGKLPRAPATDNDSPAARERDVMAAEVERLKGEIRTQAAHNKELQDALDKRAATTADSDRLKAQLNAQIARSRDLEKTSKAKDDQIAKLKNDLSVQQSHAKVLAKSVDDLQLRLQQMKRLNNQNADPSRP